MTNTTAFSKVSRKCDLACYTEIYGNFLPGICVPFDLLPGILGIFGWIVRFSKIQQLSGILETSLSFVLVSKNFVILDWMGSALWLRPSKKSFVLFIQYLSLAQPLRDLHNALRALKHRSSLRSTSYSIPKLMRSICAQVHLWLRAYSIWPKISKFL